MLSIGCVKVEIRPRDEDGVSVWVYYDGERIGLVAEARGSDDYAINYTFTAEELRLLATGATVVADAADRDGHIPYAQRGRP